MEFFILNSAYKPSTTIQNFKSLVWTERYRDAGDFKLEVENNVSILQTLPRGALVSHTDTKEVMIVEDHEIKRGGEDKKLTISVTGRSFETFATNRVTPGSEQPLKDVLGADIVYTSAVMSSPQLVVTILKNAMEAGTAPADDVVPNVAISMDMRVLDAAMAHIVKRGDAYSASLEYLNLNNAGMKIIRPEGVDTTMDIVVHDGADRRGTVTFYALYEDLEDATYFWSTRESKNYAQIAADTYARLYRDRNVVATLTGLNRRVLYVEASDIQGDFPSPTASDVVSARGQTELDQKREIALLTATISRSARPKFKLSYDVGDLVTVFAEFSIAQSMRVTEHILTVDEKGAIGYPSLSVV